MVFVRSLGRLSEVVDRGAVAVSRRDSSGRSNPPCNSCVDDLISIQLVTNYGLYRSINTR